MSFMVSIVLIVFFLMASSVKITGWHKKVFEIQLEFFRSYGLNREGMFIVGVIELTGVAFLTASLLPFMLLIDAGTAQLVGAAIIGCTSIGAIFFHLRFDTWQAAIPASITLLLSIVLAANHL